jgi:hypothetical protein
MVENKYEKNYQNNISNFFSNFLIFFLPNFINHTYYEKQYFRNTRNFEKQIIEILSLAEKISYTK